MAPLLQTRAFLKESFMNRFCLLVILILLLPCGSTFADDGEGNSGRGWALDAKIGTLGIGADLSRSIVPRLLNLRVGASLFHYTADISVRDIDYRGRLRLGAVPVVLDVFPFRNWFRIGGGVMFNLNELKGTASSASTLVIGGHPYNVQDIGMLEAKTNLHRAVPFIGFGFNNPIKKSGHHLGFFIDLGVLYHGTPSVILSSSKTFPQLQSDIRREIDDINQDIRKYNVFPVVQLGVSYHF
jgi:hypothetical protein